MSAGRPQLPPWKTGTDRERGEALLHYLHDVYGTGLVRLISLRQNKKYPFQREDMQRDVEATLDTAFRLAHDGDFAAAGAIYYLVRKRVESEVEPEARRGIVKHHRQLGAKKFREQRASKAAEKAQRIRKRAEKHQQSSNKEIAKMERVSTSTVARVRKKQKNS